MLTIQDISFHYGSRTLYEEASLQIKPKQRIGLIGPNGAGKSTLLKLIDGQLTPDAGEISKSNDTTIGFLNQDLLSFESDEPIVTVAMQAFVRQLQLQRQIDKLLKQVETDHSEATLNKLASLQDEFTTLEGYSIQAKAEEILEGLGFTTADLQKPLHTLSGGWRMRVMLAKMLLQRPSVLMLDEPTNHLDLPSIQWLENYLTSYEGAVVIVSHDREFLDRAVNTIVEVAGGNLNLYSGNYSFYEEEKELRLEVQRNAFRNQQQKIKQTERFVERFRSKATKAKQVQSRVKMLEKMDRVEGVQDDNVEMNLKFTFSRQPGKIVCTLKRISKSYGEKEVLKDSNIEIERGDKIALIGANGKGKSTLLRIIAGTEKFQGERLGGYNVIESFYAQHQLEDLNLDHEVLEELKTFGADRTETELRSVLGCFLFSDEDVFKKIKVLSGGERSRVALAKTLISEANFLLLDEPTNHLDIQSVKVLAEALRQYEGTYLLVSHDRHFISEVANKIWYIEDLQVKAYPGTYQEFVQWYDDRQAARAEAENAVQQASSKQKTGKKKEWKNQPELQAMQKELKQTEKELQQNEEKVMALEEKTGRLEAEMAKPAVYGDPYQLAEATEKYEKAKKELANANKTWETLAEKVEALQEQLRDE